MKKVALVTGASGNGIGRSTALTLAREGYQLVINYLTNKDQAEKVCKYIRKNGGQAVPVQADVFSPDECHYLINETISVYNRLDVCIIGPGADWNPEPPEKLNPQKSLNDIIQEISPIYSLIPLILPEMSKRKEGRIIAIASNPELPSPSYSYNVAKNARISAILELADSCWEQRITVNVVAPGPIDHIKELDHAIEHTINFPDSQTKITPQDVAELISFLCSKKARFITGNVMGAYF